MLMCLHNRGRDGPMMGGKLETEAKPREVLLLQPTLIISKKAGKQQVMG